MKKFFAFLSSLILVLALTSVVFADQYIQGYYRRDGTYVQPHYRSDPDRSPYNNYSYPGNVNPYTGQVAPGNPDTYLRRYRERQNPNPYGYPRNPSGYSQ